MRNDLKKIKENRFGGFIKWMNARNIDINFDNTIWALAIFGELYDAYKKEEDNAIILRRGLDTMPTDMMEQELKMRKDREKKIAEEVERRDSKILRPNEAKENKIQIR